MSKTDVRRLSRDEVESTAVLRRIMDQGKPEVAATASRILNDPQAFAAFVELRRQRRINWIVKNRRRAETPAEVEAKIEAKPRWSFRELVSEFLAGWRRKPVTA